MLHPSYTELMDLINQDSDEDTPVVGSRYSVVMAAAKRARQLIDGKTGLPEEELHKPLSTAVQELWDGDIRIVREDTDMRMRKLLMNPGQRRNKRTLCGRFC